MSKHWWPRLISYLVVCYTVPVTKTCQFSNRRTAVVLLNFSLENIIKTITRSVWNAHSTVRQRVLRLTKTDVLFQLLPCAGAPYLIVLVREFKSRMRTK